MHSEIVEKAKAAQKETNPGAQHKALLDWGEALLNLCVGWCYLQWKNTFIAILSNTIEQITVYALGVGINKETIVAKIDRSRRNEKIFENKIKEFYQMNKRDDKSVEELKQFAKELGLGKNQITLALSRANW